MSVHLQSPSLSARWLAFLRTTRRLRLPFALLSTVAVILVAPGLVGLWVAVLGIVFALLPQPWRVRRPPRRPRSPAGRRWLAQQRSPSARVYVLWSEAEWAARSAALPWQPRRRWFTRGPV